MCNNIWTFLKTRGKLWGIAAASGGNETDRMWLPRTDIEYRAAQKPHLYKLCVGGGGWKGVPQTFTAQSIHRPSQWEGKYLLL